MDQLNVGIAGFGIVGKRRLTFIEKNPFLKLKAVCDKNFKENGTINNDVRSYSSYLDLLEEDLDVLFVCLTNDLNPKVTIAGLEKGMHVFCEKPPGRTLSDIEEVIKVKNKFKNQYLMYGFNHRFHDSIKDAIEIINSKELGKIINIRGVYGKSKIITFEQSDWRTKREIAGGGVLLDQGIHMVDLMRLFAGDFTEVHSFVTNSHWGYEVEDNAYALMRTSDGIIAMLNSSATQWRHIFNLEINLQKGSLVLGGLLTGSKSYGAETLTVIKTDSKSDNGEPKETLTKYNRDPSWEREINLFVNCIRNKTPLTDGSPEDAYNSMKVLYRIYHADPIWRDKYNIPNPDRTEP